MASPAWFEEVASFPVQGYRVFSIVAVPGGGLATGHSFTDGSIVVWSGEGVLEATLEGHTGIVHALACSASGDIVSGSYDKTVKVWRDHTCVLTCVGHTDTVDCVAVSPVDGSIVSGSEDRTAKVWSSTTGVCVGTLGGHRESVTAVCVLENGDIVTGSYDQTVRVWERGTWTCVGVEVYPDSVNVVAAQPLGGFAVGGGCLGVAATGFLSMRGGAGEEWHTTTTTGVVRLANMNDIIVVGTETSVELVHGGTVLGRMDASWPLLTVHPTGKLAVVDRPGAEARAVRVFRVVRPSRLATIDVMVTAWSLHGGTPPPLADTWTAATALARTVSLRRFCRMCGGGEKAEVVEPFARDIVGYM